MKLKTIIAALAALSTTLIQANNIFIKNAQQKDIPGIMELDKEITDEFWMPVMIAGYPELFAHNLDLLNKCNEEWDAYIDTILEKGTSNEPNNNQHILIASDEKEPDKILGFCAFAKQKNHLYIQYFEVAQRARNKGIGKALLNKALSTYNDVPLCMLETLANNNESTQAFYEKYGFIKKELCTLDKNMPNGHMRYELDIKK